MTDEYSKKLEKELKEKNAQLEEIKKKLLETEKKLNELNRELEQRVIERTIEVNRLLLHKTKFIDSLSHDLGTPLTPLMALLPLIKEEVKDPKVKDLVDTCIRSAKYLKNLVNHTKELAELSTSELYLKKENLLEIVNKLQEKYDVVFRSYNINVENNIDENIYVKTEKPRIMEILDHISSNAVNSMLNGGTLTFDAKELEKKTGSFIDISISDTGIGLSEDQTSHLFDEFYKADESRHKLDSTGLGLSICKRIVELHGGRIWADSRRERKGTIIHFIIPSG